LEPFRDYTGSLRERPSISSVKQMKVTTGLLLC
jgi:hypothetical protein